MLLSLNRRKNEEKTLLLPFTITRQTQQQVVSALALHSQVEMLYK